MITYEYPQQREDRFKDVPTKGKKTCPTRLDGAFEFAKIAHEHNLSFIQARLKD